MIPITRKDLYLNKIVGNDDYDIPEKPIPEEELFFAEILGEAVQAPEPLPRYQMYLAKIAGREIEIPYPKVRLEYFLARAAGMNVETPAPITKEEIYWSNYTAVMEFETENVPPLTYKAIEGTLKNYRIYGNTVNGESVGDRTANLWDETIIQGGTNNTGTITDGNPKRLRSDYIFVEPGETYSFASNLKIRLIYSYDDNNQKVSLIRDAPNGDISYTFTVPNAATKIIITVMKRINNVEYDLTPDDFEWGQLEKGSVVTSYEPYGYRVPVTVEGKNLCNNIWEQGGIDSNTGNVVPQQSIECCDFIPVKPNVTYSCSRTIANNYTNLRCYGTNKNYLGTGADLASKGNPLKQGELFGTFMITDARVSYIRFNDLSNSLDTKYMFVEGIYTAETMPPYEPYYEPVTTNLYLPEPIKMVGDEAEYIDYAEQKMHRIGADDIDVTLPALPVLPGTNTLTVGTEVQPSSVEIKGRIKAAGGD